MAYIKLRVAIDIKINGFYDVINTPLYNTLIIA